MRIAIITLKLHTNYGGILQAYALQKALQKEGHDVVTLQCKNKYVHINLSSLLIYIYRIIKKCIGKYNKPILLEKRIRKNDKIVSTNTQSFIDNSINIIGINSFNEIKEDDYDAFVVGSDQVWRKKYFEFDWNTIISNAFLRFAKKWEIKRYAYAASFGIDDIDKEYNSKDIKRCRDSAKLFDAISVRETSGVEICNTKFGVVATHVLDPTLLLDKEEYINLVKKSDVPKSNGNLFCYILDPNEYKASLIRKIACIKGYHPFYLGIKYNEYGKGKNIKPQPPVESWIRSFMDADFIITDSFHACVFSYIFNKPFLVIGNISRGLTRIASLLRLFNLQDRLITETEDLSQERIVQLTNQRSEYNNSNFEILKENSLTFINNIGK